MRKAAIALFGLLLTSFAACNRDGVIEADASPAPVIALDSETGVYTVKAGRELTISPVTNTPTTPVSVGRWTAG